MKQIIHISAWTVIFSMLTACGGEEQSTSEVDPYEQMEELKNNGLGPSDDGHSHGDHGGEQSFHVEVPERMNEITDLNPNASAQYVYVEEAINQAGDTLVFEHYLVILEETFEEMKTYPDTTLQHVGVDGYQAMVLSNLEQGLENFMVTATDSAPQEMNNMEAMNSEMRGDIRISENETAPIFYKLAIFKGEKAFYQVLTWCVEDQKMEFIEDMEAIINSFHEH